MDSIKDRLTKIKECHTFNITTKQVEDDFLMASVLLSRKGVIPVVCFVTENIMHKLIYDLGPRTFFVNVNSLFDRQWSGIRIPSCYGSTVVISCPSLENNTMIFIEDKFII